MCVETAYIGLGSNLGDRLAALEAALGALARLEGLDLVAVSAAYETAPVGPVAQGDYLNAVTQVRTRLKPRALLEALLQIERGHGRERRERWGPRTLDLDLLLWGRVRVAEPGLVVPHPRLTERRFVLEPLLEIAPDLVHPDGGRPLAHDLAALGEGERVRKAAALRLPT